MVLSRTAPERWWSRVSSALVAGEWGRARGSFEAALEQEETAEALNGLGIALGWLDEVEASLRYRERACAEFRRWSEADALEQLCGPDYCAETAWPIPSGEAALPALQASTAATVGNVGPTPVLLVFADRDAAFPGPAHDGSDPDVVTPEIAMWRNGCNCDVSVYVQPNAGHVGLLHRTSKRLTDMILDWLDRHDL